MPQNKSKSVLSKENKNEKIISIKFLFIFYFNMRIDLCKYLNLLFFKAYIIRKFSKIINLISTLHQMKKQIIFICLYILTDNF